MANIITENINGILFNELRDYMQSMVYESMKAIDPHDIESLEWYEDCSMTEYFHEWTEIWDEDEKVGDGIDTIAHKFVLNDDTRSDFEIAFEHARNDAFEEYMKGLAEEIEDWGDDYRLIKLDDPDKLNDVEERLKEYDYELFAYDKMDDHGFFKDSFFYEKLMEYGASIEDVAVWAGTAIIVLYEDGQEYEKQFYTGAEIEEVDEDLFAAVYKHSKEVCMEQQGFYSDVECDLLFNKFATDWIDDYENVTEDCNDLYDFLENAYAFSAYYDKSSGISYYKGRNIDTNKHCTFFLDEDGKLRFYS